jgi:hypothetical protein
MEGQMIIKEKHWISLILVGWIWIALVAVPVSFWINVRHVTVASAETPADVTMRVDRDIKRPFAGSFVVTVRRSPGGGFVCSTGSSKMIVYRPNAEMPDPLYLWWWLGSKAALASCDDFRPGGYLLETCWTVLQPFWGVVPEKTWCIDSNGFKIGGSP